MAKLGSALVRWWRRRGLRSRVTLTAALGLLVALAAADLLLFNALRVSLTRSVDDTARTGASQVVALINEGRLPDPVPVVAGTIQVLDPAGRIVDGSAGADRLVPLVTPSQASALATGGSATLVQGAPYDLPSALRVAAVRAADGDLVIAAVPYSAASGSLSVVAKALIFGTPVVFLAFTGAIWLVVGSTLRPIDMLRRGAARVTGAGAGESLPVPEARDEVRSLALTLNDMVSRLATAQQRQRALVSDTAHELRSPITSIRAQLEVALDHPSGQDWAETARDVLADTLRLSRLAEDLLLLARLDEHAGPGRGSPVDLGELSRAVVCRYADAHVPVIADVAAGSAAAGSTAGASAAAGSTADAGAGGAPGRVMVMGDRATLDRLLVNLVDNAVRYAKSEVRVCVGRAGEWAELTVCDDGPGIPESDRERVFDRFARLDDARSREGDEAGGAGLGLAIVRATAQAYGGTARLDDNPGSPSGLRAIVRLPMTRADSLQPQSLSG